ESVSITLNNVTKIETTGAGGSFATTFPTAVLGVASPPYTITYHFAGDGAFLPATAHANLTVIQASTTTTLGAPATVMAPGQEVTFTATVKPTAPGGGTPTGSVTFLNRTTSLGTVSLDSSGVATFTTSGLSAGAQAITAVYGGDSNFTGSQGTATQTVLNKG